MTAGYTRRLIINVAIAFAAALLSAAGYVAAASLLGMGSGEPLKDLGGTVAFGYPFVLALVLGGAAYSAFLLPLVRVRAFSARMRIAAFVLSPVAAVPYLLLMGFLFGLPPISLVWPIIFVALLGFLVRLR